ncbi:MAG: hypothetical protein GC190_09395 [Alphaproteobacteria bacterium]|nr:hypothetical protein [Alphaproteobacteria bacterium]
MAGLLSNLRNAVITGFVLAFVVYVLSAFLFHGTINLMSAPFWWYPVRWMHVLSGIVWIGLLYYFNLVQVPLMPKIPDDQKPAISKVIAPEALWWFRWGAMSTLFFGLWLAFLNDYLIAALTLGAAEGFSDASHTLIGIGMWLGIVMWFNVWFVIWPNQQRALNIENRFPDLTKDQRASHGRTAMLFSRTNTVLSLPMLLCMIGASHYGFG